MTKGVTLHVVERMLQCGVSLEDFFTFDNSRLCRALEMSTSMVIDRYSREQALYAARNEVEFMARHSIKGIFVGDKDYPYRMAQCSDAPILLYMLGNCNLNASHSISVVGTRKVTPYGAEMTARFVKELAASFPDICVVSGLAYGTDAKAHISALEASVPTVAVVAHGLNTIYPAAHRDLAKRIIQSGGALLSEYPSGTSAYRQHFLARNRIVAWMSDASLIIESEVKGGAMSTANYAFRENRDVFAIPGRASDPMSAGCNNLIRRNKAALATSAGDIIDALGWSPDVKSAVSAVGSLFPEVSGDEKVIHDILKQKDIPVSADDIHVLSGLPMPKLASLLAEMEFEGLILRHPGNRFSIG